MRWPCIAVAGSPAYAAQLACAISLTRRTHASNDGSENTSSFPSTSPRCSAHSDSLDHATQGIAFHVTCIGRLPHTLRRKSAAAMSKGIEDCRARIPSATEQQSWPSAPEVADAAAVGVLGGGWAGLAPRGCAPPRALTQFPPCQLPLDSWPELCPRLRRPAAARRRWLPQTPA